MINAQIHHDLSNDRFSVTCYGDPRSPETARWAVENKFRHCVNIYFNNSKHPVISSPGRRLTSFEEGEELAATISYACEIAKKAIAKK